MRPSGKRLVGLLGLAMAAAALGQAKGPHGVFRTDVPVHTLDVVLARPTAASVTLSVLAYADTQAYVAYGLGQGDFVFRTGLRELKAGVPEETVLEKLTVDTAYAYELRDATGKALATGAFHTQRPPGSTFVFTVQADSHLDENTSPVLYQRTLANELADTPDFLIDMGDTFMTGKHAGRETAAKQYLAQRYYLGLVGRAAPVFLVLGNHDGEEARLQRGGADSLAVWSNSMRKRYFLSPMPDAFYGGNEVKHPLAGALQDYYSWEWGDALFIVLDPYWYASARRSDDCWDPTLGAEQYQWLKRTLESSKAQLKFVFIHQLVGGRDRQGRGGVEAAPFGEWGGKSADGTDGFKEHRPGWEMPIHELLVRNRVSIVFHGHDHLFAKQELDGIVYQTVPQPGFPGLGAPRSAAEYGYVSGTVLGGAGHLRVTVGRSEAKVEYVRAFLPKDETTQRRNGQVVVAYAVQSCGDSHGSAAPSP